MRIEHISYKRLVNLGSYNNETFEATAVVEVGDNASAAAEELRNFVEQQVAVRETIEQMLAQHHALEQEVEKHKDRVRLIREQWNILAEKLEGNNLTVGEILAIIEIPF